MNLFFGNYSDGNFILEESEQHHISKVLRIKEKEEIFVTDGKGILAKSYISYKGKKVEINIIEQIKVSSPKKPELHIAIAPTKNIDRFEFFIEKAVELGVGEITPILTSNSERKNIKTEKLEKKMLSACKQSLRTYFPKINSLTSLKDLLLKEINNLYFAHCYKEYPKISINEVFLQNDKSEKITIIIGPEGDFSKSELDSLKNIGAQGIDLGKNRLRTETAGIFVAATYWYEINSK